jgi:hypothetical protein
MVIFWQWLKAQRRHVEFLLLAILLNDDARRDLARVMRAKVGQ